MSTHPQRLSRILLRVMSTVNRSTKSTNCSCGACMTRTPPNVRRRLDRRGPLEPWRGDLKAHAWAKQNALQEAFFRSVWLESLFAQMPRHVACRHIHEDSQEFFFGSCPRSTHQIQVQQRANMMSVSSPTAEKNLHWSAWLSSFLPETSSGWALYTEGPDHKHVASLA